MSTRRPREAAAEPVAVPRSIKGDSLRQFAASDGRRRTSVIVQTHLIFDGGIAGRVDTAAAKRHFEALKQDLSRLGLLERARSVSLISGFVLEVTPRQLRRLALADSVKSIWPNMWHRLVRPPLRSRSDKPM